MKAMFAQHVRPWLREETGRRGGQVMRTLSLHTFGVGESDIAARLGDLLSRRPEAQGLQVGTTASGGIVSIRAYAAGATGAEAEQKLSAVESAARQKLDELIFGRDGETLAEVVGRMLREHPRRPVLRVAESCTGGLLGKLITDVAGSSSYFDRGWITYANEAKTDMLGVPANLISRQGAVSEEVASAMAAGALIAGGVPEGRGGVAVSISGVAGPGGGTPQKPVGMVCIGLATRGLAGGGDAGLFVSARTFYFVGDRDLIRQRSAMMALAMLRYHLLGIEMPF
jgi:nicotinamide-nucleotide amidase